MRILVIEDNQDIAANLGDFLEDRVHTVDFAADGITGLHLAVVHDFDAVGREVDGVAAVLEVVAEVGGDVLVVFDHEDAHGGSCLGACPSLPEHKGRPSRGGCRAGPKVLPRLP